MAYYAERILDILEEAGGIVASGEEERISTQMIEEVEKKAREKLERELPPTP